MREKILVVDDNERIAQAIGISLRLLGYQVVLAHDGLQAESSLRTAPPDLVILDVMMPGKNGFAVCRDLKLDPSLARIPVIILTAKDRQEDVFWGHDCGADAYVTKPYDARRLEALVAQLLKEAQEGRRTMSWTGLPTADCVRREQRARLEAGGMVALLEARLEGRSVEIYRMKYGCAQHQRLFSSLCQSFDSLMRSHSSAGISGVEGDEGILLLLHPREVAGLLPLLQECAGEMLSDAYTLQDREQGCIRFPDPLCGKEERVPLMSIQFQLSECEAIKEMTLQAGVG